MKVKKLRVKAKRSREKFRNCTFWGGGLLETVPVGFRWLRLRVLVGWAGIWGGLGLFCWRVVPLASQVRPRGSQSVVRDLSRRNSNFNLKIIISILCKKGSKSWLPISKWANQNGSEFDRDQWTRNEVTKRHQLIDIFLRPQNHYLPSCGIWTGLFLKFYDCENERSFTFIHIRVRKHLLHENWRQFESTTLLSSSFSFFSGEVYAALVECG